MASELEPRSLEQMPHCFCWRCRAPGFRVELALLLRALISSLGFPICQGKADTAALGSLQAPICHSHPRQFSLPVPINQSPSLALPGTPLSLPAPTMATCPGLCSLGEQAFGLPPGTSPGVKRWLRSCFQNLQHTCLESWVADGS